MKQTVPFTLATLSLVLAAVPSAVFAQAQPVCYFGECDTAPPQRHAPEPAPRRQPDVPAPRPQPLPPPPPAPSEPRTLPDFFARNMCFMDNVAVPVRDGETCERLYRNPASGRSDGHPVECGVLTRMSDGTVSVNAILVGTVGECWGVRNNRHVGLPVMGRCNTGFPGGFFHWRLDLDEYQCVNGSDPRIILRP